ncbi:MAG: fumarylacetoacetate hydrolase family protein [Thermoplasmataceae archaeon]|jgi:fumarylacetoacetate (FAA) hydrolase|nr:fumarylacetoacetate hydrolase family protein [Candidatus Thermoplasmatota archaeon]
MKIARIRSDEGRSVAVYGKGRWIDLSTVLNDSIENIERSLFSVITKNREKIQKFIEETPSEEMVEVVPRTMLIPVPKVNQIRDFYAFEEHVRRSRESRGLEMVPEWYEFPAFYYSGTSNLFGSNDPIPYPSYSSEVDYELEVGAVIGKEGRNISRGEAREYIFGLVLMNDWSARDVQRKEMKIGLGPAKSKDFATSFGPFIVSMDELVDMTNQEGKIDVDLSASVNGNHYSSGNLKSIHWDFEDMIAWASQETTLRPGDIMMSGTVGTGCILEIGHEEYGWLKRGDTVQFHSDILGDTSNKLTEA